MASFNTRFNGSYTTSFGPQNNVTVSHPLPASNVRPTSSVNMKAYVKPYTQITRLFSKSHYSFSLKIIKKESLNINSYNSNNSINSSNFIASAVRQDGGNAYFQYPDTVELAIGDIIEIYDCHCPGKPVGDRYEFAEVVRTEKL